MNLVISQTEADSTQAHQISNRKLVLEKAWEHIVSPTGSVFQKQRVGYRVGQGFTSGLFQKHCVGGYRSRYT